MTKELEDKKTLIGIIMPIRDEVETLKEITPLLQKFNKQNPGKVAHCYPIFDPLTSLEVKEYCKVNESPTLRPLEMQEANGPVSLYLNGYKKALVDNMDYIAEIDAGGSHPCGVLFNILEELIPGEGGYFSTRLKEGGGFEGMSLLRQSVTRLATICGNLLYRTRYSDLSGGMKITRSDLARKAINQNFPKGSGWQLLYKISLKNDAIKEFPIIYKSSSSAFKFKWIVWALIGLIKLRGKNK